MEAKSRFTCLYARNHMVFTVYARNRREADRMTHYESGLIIQGEMRDIRVRRVNYDYTVGCSVTRVRSNLRMGAVCTITVGSSGVRKTYRIANATYQGRVTINTDSFLTFSKNGVRFYAYITQVKFISISGRKL